MTALTSQLSPSDSSVTQQTGAGQWQVQALDDKQQALTLQGTLNYRVAAQGKGSQASNGSIVLSGTLQATDVALALDVTSQLQNDGGKRTSTSRTQLKLARNGQTQATDLNTSTQTNVLAYNLTQVVAHSTVNRDGKTGQSTQTISTLNLGRGESEVWLQADSQSGSGGSKSVSEHLFQRVNGGSVMQYLGRYDLKTADNRYSLQAPVSLDGSLDGSMRFSLTLVDQNGKAVNVSSPAAPGTGYSSGRIRGLAMPLSVDPGNTSNLPRTSAPLGDLLNLGTGGQITPAAGGCFGIGGYGVAAGATLIAATVAALAIGAELAAALTVGVALGLVNGAVLAEVLWLAVNAACELDNADPYFISPDSRSGVDRVNPAPLQITRVTRGLVTPPQTNTLVQAASTNSLGS